MSGCEKIRRTIEEALDGPVSAERDALAKTHLRACSACREHREGLLTVQSALRALPSIPLPDDALELVWKKTIRREARLSRRHAPRIGWRLAAAAAVIATVLALPAVFRPLSRPYTPADLSQAARDARSVLVLTGDAFRKSRHAAVTQVIAGEVSPAMRKIPIRWSSPKKPDSRRPRT